MDNQTVGQSLLYIYRQLFDHYGPQHWWPADEPFEVIVGAVLTQSAAWGNVEKSIANLKAAKALSPQALRRLSLDEIARLIHPCGYYNAKTLKRFYSFLVAPHLFNVGIFGVILGIGFVMRGLRGVMGILAVFSYGCSTTSFQLRKGKRIPATLAGVRSFKLMCGLKKL